MMLTLAISFLIAAVTFYLLDRREKTRHNNVVTLWKANVELKRLMKEKGQKFRHEDFKVPANWNKRQRDLYVQLWHDTDNPNPFDLSGRATKLLKYRREERARQLWLKMRDATLRYVRLAEERDLSQKQINKLLSRKSRANKNSKRFAPFGPSERTRQSHLRQAHTREQARLIREWARQGWRLTVDRERGLTFVRTDREDGIYVYHDVPRILKQKAPVVYVLRGKREAA